MMARGIEIQGFSVYPNPVRGEVYVDLNELSTSTSFKILNKQGKVVQQNRNLIVRNTISLKALPSGLYTIEVKNNNMVMTKKILKL